MNPGDHPLFGTRTSLVHCPDCQGRLDYTIDGAEARDVVIHRACPGCGYGDSVVTSSLSAAIWFRRETRILSELRPLAMFLAESSTADNPLVAEGLHGTG
jgi:hypothetical protein